jgi:hypothetical protein
VSDVAFLGFAMMTFLKRLFVIRYWFFVYLTLQEIQVFTRND